MRFDQGHFRFDRRANIGRYQPAGTGADLRGMLTQIPENRLLVETDAPYLTPAPERNRHRRNEPAFVRTTLLKVAEVRGTDPEALAAQVWSNTCGLYGIDAAEIETAAG